MQKKLLHFKTGWKASVVHLLLWNALETMTATIILVIYLLIFPHIHLPRTVLKIYKQCISFQALLEFFVFESEWKTNLSTQIAVSSLNSFAWVQVWHFEEKNKTKKLRDATCKGWTKMITVLAGLRKHLNKQHKKKHGQTMEFCGSSFKI